MPFACARSTAALIVSRLDTFDETTFAVEELHKLVFIPEIELRESSLPQAPISQGECTSDRRLRGQGIIEGEL